MPIICTCTACVIVYAIVRRCGTRVLGSVLCQNTKIRTLYQTWPVTTTARHSLPHGNSNYTYKYVYCCRIVLTVNTSQMHPKPRPVHVSDICTSSNKTPTTHGYKSIIIVLWWYIIIYTHPPTLIITNTHCMCIHVLQHEVHVCMLRSHGVVCDAVVMVASLPLTYARRGWSRDLIHLRVNSSL